MRHAVAGALVTLVFVFGGMLAFTSHHDSGYAQIRVAVSSEEGGSSATANKRNLTCPAAHHCHDLLRDFERNTAWLFPQQWKPWSVGMLSEARFTVDELNDGKCDTPEGHAAMPSAPPFRATPESFTHHAYKQLRGAPSTAPDANELIATKRIHRHVLESVCFSPHGPMTARLVNETSLTIRVNDESMMDFPLTVDSRETDPTCMFDVAVHVWPIRLDYSVMSSNFGHLLYKHLSALALQLRVAALNEGHTTHSPTLSILYIFGSNGKDDEYIRGKRTLLEELLPMSTQRWAVVFAPSNSSMRPPSGLTRTSGEFCVRKAVVGYADFSMDNLRTKEMESVALKSRELAMRHFQVKNPKPSVGGGSRTITVLFRSGRAIYKLDRLVEAARKEFPDHTIQYVNMAKKPFRRQAEIAASTDVLIGAHGTGLQWSWLMPEGSVVVEVNCYYRFGSVSGIDVRCDSAVGGTPPIFKVLHLGYRVTKPCKRDSFIPLTAKEFVALVRVALCQRGTPSQCSWDGLSSAHLVTNGRECLLD